VSTPIPLPPGPPGPPPYGKLHSLDPLSIYIGGCLKAIRKERGLTQEDVAEKLGITGSALSYCEKGRSQMRLRQFMQMCDVLDVDPAVIITTIIQAQPHLIRGERSQKQ
jgi:transcriptional regulator with XRE-family HTH domain